MNIITSQLNPQKNSKGRQQNSVFLIPTMTELKGSHQQNGSEDVLSSHGKIPNSNYEFKFQP